jgi:hypothetical protein
MINLLNRWHDITNKRPKEFDYTLVTYYNSSNPKKVGMSIGYYLGQIDDVGNWVIVGLIDGIPYNFLKCVITHWKKVDVKYPSYKYYNND